MVMVVMLMPMVMTLLTTMLVMLLTRVMMLVRTTVRIMMLLTMRTITQIVYGYRGLSWWPRNRSAQAGPARSRAERSA